VELRGKAIGAPNHPRSFSQFLSRFPKTLQPAPTCIAACCFDCARDNFFIVSTVPGGGGAFLTRCWVLYTVEISYLEFFIIATNFLRQDYFSIVTTTYRAMCAYGEA
jgi:hypothetical protein